MPLCTCEKPNFLKYSHLKPISVTTFMKYMKLLTIALEKKIANLLPSKFPLIFDGWSLNGSSTHYVAIFARWLSEGILLAYIRSFFVFFHDSQGNTRKLCLPFPLF